MRIVITSAPFSPEAETSRLATSDTGAVVTFSGYCRGARGDEPVSWLELEHYPGFTESEIERLCHRIYAEHDLDDLIVTHRVGRIAPGEAIVLVAAASAHRAAAFAAVEHLMDYLKTDAPFWKREMRDDGAHWIEPTDEDRRRRASREKRKQI